MDSTVPLHGPVHFPSVILGLECLTLVELLLSPAQVDVEFGQSLLVDEHEGGHDAVAGCLLPAEQLARRSLRSRRST